MADPQGTDEERKKVTKTILSLTLEIIYLLTGEDYTAVMKMSCDHVTPFSQSNVSRSESPIVKPPPCSLIIEGNTTGKILDVTQKIIELLTGEVPIRCQDVSVYFSMEEWEYLEGHKDLYGDVMMENRPPLTSPDGSRKRNTPERCPRPLYSRDSTQEHQKIPQVHPLYSWDSTQEHQKIPQEHHEIPQYDQDKGLIVVEVEDTYVSGDYTCKEEEIPTEIGTDAQHNWNNMDKPPVIFPENDIKNEDITWESFEETPVVHLIAHSADPPTRGGFAAQSFPVTHHTGNKTFRCSECGKCFNRRGGLMVHRRSHTGVKQFSCPQCGKCFIYRSFLSRHERVHTGEKPYTCSKCGKSFSQRNSLFTHERTHTGAKPYTCSVCGKCFTDRSNLLRHEKLHIGDRPYSCS